MTKRAGITLFVLPALLAGQAAVAQWEPTAGIRQPLSVQQTAFEYDYYIYATDDDEAPAASPSDEPGVAAANDDAAAAPPYVVYDPSDSYLHRGYQGQAVPYYRSDGPWRIPQPSFLADRGVEIGGWLAQGLTFNSRNPADRFNGPVTFNDRANEYQLNQLWLYAEREADTGGYGFDLGGRVDFVYGTDARFTQADGLETRWNQKRRFYQAALPQLYMDVALNRMTFRVGHFFTILGYERVEATRNFFYSHAYAHQYAEPFTHTGMLAMWDLSDQWSVAAGFHRGADQFEDLDGLDALNFLGGVSWKSRNERVGVDFGLNADEFGPMTNRLQYSLVTTLGVTERLSWILQHDYVQETDKRIDVGEEGRFAEAYGLNQYFLYDINPCWAAGLRVEWFRDHNGAFVAGIDPGNETFDGGFKGNFYAVSAGLNWKPTANVTVRPELRWDWFRGEGNPFNAGNSKDQFLFATDAIITF